MRYKMVFSDIDGTLLDSNHQITGGTKEAVRKLTQNGIPFVLVSARMPYGILPLTEALHINEPIICFSGALVLGALQSDGTREELYNQTLNTEDVEEMYSITSESYPEISFSAYNGRHWFVSSRNDEWIEQEYKITGTPPQYFKFEDDPIPACHKIMCMGEAPAIERLEAELKSRYPEHTIYKSKTTYLEIMAPHVSKSSAIEVLIKQYGIEQEEIIAVGDNYNDMDMLKYAGLGVAMGNAPEEVKAAADQVTLCNDEDGVKTLLEQVFG